MHTLTVVASWIVEHPRNVVDLLALIGFVLSCVTALIPSSAQRLPWIGPVVRWLNRFSVLTHKDQEGTLKWPGVLQAAATATQETSPTIAPPAPAPSPVADASAPPATQG